MSTGKGIFLGSLPVKKIYLGNTPVKKVYLGTTLIWPREFDPTQLSDLLVWQRSDLGVITSGSSVTAWQDQSGNGNDLTSASGSRPTFTASGINGRPSISFAAGQFFTLNTMLNLRMNGGTSFIVCTFAGPIQVLAAKDADNYYAIRPLQIDISNVAIKFHSMTIGDPFVFCGITRGAAGLTAVGINGVFGADSFTSIGHDIRIISYDINPSVGYTGEISEIIAYGRELTVDEITEVITYLQTRYNL